MHSVFLVADIRIYREGVADAIGSAPTLSLVGLAARADDAMLRIRKTTPDIVLIDTAMRGGLALIRRVVDEAPAVKIVALGVAQANEVLTCAEAGISGYVPREASLTELVAAVQSVGQGEAICSPAVAATLMRRVATLAGTGSQGAEARLTARQREIVRLVDRGLSNKEIARELGIEVATVKNHVHHLLERLDVHRRGEAAARVRGPGRASSG